MPAPADTPSISALWEAFCAPPDNARPHVWWHWMDGNVDPAGLVRDLDWLYDVGVRGAHVFHGGMGGPCYLDEPVRPGDPRWRAALDLAGDHAAAKGMELAVATSSGWSAAGAPWVRPADAMKKLVWSEQVVDAADPAPILLTAPPRTAGPFQDCAVALPGVAEHVQVPWRVVAFPADHVRHPLIPDRVRASAPLDDATPLWDGRFAEGVHLPRDPDATSSAWISQDFATPVTVSSVRLGLPGPRGFGAAPAPNALLEAEEDDGTWRQIARLDPEFSPARTASFAPVTARRFRLTLEAASAADSLPRQAPGVRTPPVLRRAATFQVTEFALYTAGRVHRAESKAGFGAPPLHLDISTPAEATAGAIEPAAVLDLTSLRRGDTLHWTPPAGRWHVITFAATLTGATNGPAPADSTGLEVDKLDGERVRAYLERHLVDVGTPRLTALLSDSIESGPQNFTERIGEHFQRLRGYDLTPYLPALAGWIVGDAETTDAALADFRRTIADLIAEHYYGTIARVARERGLRTYAEALEDGRPQLGDDLDMRAHADVPMGAMWTFGPHEQSAPTYIADLKGAASVGHVYGRSHVGAEAFTTFSSPWASTPGTLKHVADLQLTLGVTRFCIHSSPHQPLAAPAPGVTLAPFLGQSFTRHETWAGMAHGWIDYLSRCSAALSWGAPDVAVAVCLGEEAPVTGRFAHRLDDTVPPGYDFDYVSARALVEVLRVDADGDLLARGARYRLLALQMTEASVPLLRRLEDLVAAGATIVGPRPRRAASLTDRARFADLVDRLWGTPEHPGPIRDVPLAAALRERGAPPQVELDDPQVRWIARRGEDGARVVFLANPSECARTVRVRLAEGAPSEAWNPVTPARTALSADADGWYTLALAASESVILVTSLTASAPAAAPATTALELTGPWEVSVGTHPRWVEHGPLRPWTESHPATRSFSGVGEYRTSFALPSPCPATVRLEAAGVEGIAEVVVNGHSEGTCWTPPFALDVTQACHAGENSLVLRVAVPWRNRLIAEAADPSGEVPTALTQVFEADAATLAAGMRGEVAVHHSVAPGRADH